MVGYYQEITLSYETEYPRYLEYYILELTPAQTQEMPDRPQSLWAY